MSDVRIWDLLDMFNGKGFNDPGRLYGNIHRDGIVGGIQQHAVIKRLSWWLANRTEFSFSGFFKPVDPSEVINDGPTMAAATLATQTPGEIMLFLQVTTQHISYAVGGMNYRVNISAKGIYDPDGDYDIMHIALTYKAGHVKLYVNNEMISDVYTITQMPLDMDNDVYLGRHPNDVRESYAAAWGVEALRFYDHELSAAEVSILDYPENYNNVEYDVRNYFVPLKPPVSKGLEAYITGDRGETINELTSGEWVSFVKTYNGGCVGPSIAKVAGIRGYAIEGGNDSFMGLGSISYWFSNRDAFVICGFFKPSLHVKGQGGILSIGGPDSDGGVGLVFKLTPDNLYVEMAGTPKAIISIDDYFGDYDYHVAITFSNSQLKVYIEGELRATAAAAALSPTITVDACIGRVNSSDYYQSAIDNAVDWRIDELCFFNNDGDNALTDADIIKLSNPLNYDPNYVRNAKPIPPVGNPGPPVTDGLDAWFTFENYEGNTVVDEMGNYSGTVNGSKNLIDGKSLEAITGGMSDFVVLNGLGNWFNTVRTGSFTICGFFKPATYGQGTSDYLNIPGLNSTEFALRLRFQSWVLMVEIPGYDAYQNSPNYSTDTFYHIAICFDDNQLSIWVNGLRVAMVDTPNGFYPATADVTIGRDRENSYHQVENWAVDELCFYNRALTDHELIAMADPVKYIKAGGLISYHKMNIFDGTVGNYLSPDEMNAYPATVITPVGQMSDAGGSSLIGALGEGYLNIKGLGTWLATCTEFSVSLFSKASASYTGEGPLICASVDGHAPPYYPFRIKFRNDGLVVEVNSFPDAVNVAAPFDDRFYHIAITYKDMAYKVYLDGVLVGSGVSVKALTETDIMADVMIGRIPAVNGPENNAAWVIDCLKFYDRSITAGEVLALSTDRS